MDFIYPEEQRKRDIDAERERLRKKYEDAKDLNPRYLAYCKANGKTPSEMIVHDYDRWPGGINCGFSLWIQSKWREWEQIHIAQTPEFQKYDEHAKRLFCSLLRCEPKGLMLG